MVTMVRLVTSLVLMAGLIGVSRVGAQAPVTQASQISLMAESEFKLNLDQFRVLELQLSWPPEVQQPVDAGAGARLWSCDVGAVDAPPLLLVSAADNRRIWVNTSRDQQWFELSSQPGTIGSNGASPMWQASVLSQPSSSTKRIWPTPDSIPLRLYYHQALDLWLVATAVGWKGRLEVNGTWLNFQLIDANHDGRLDSADDQLSVDLNGNGQYERLRESFPLTRFWRFQGKRYALAIDHQARRFGAQAIEKTGQMQVQFTQSKHQQRPTSFCISLISELGIHVVITGSDPVSVPVGIYRLHSATLSWSDQEKARATFARNEHAGSVHSFHVEPDQITNVLAIGMLELGAKLQTRSTNGNELQIQPFMVSDTGLYLTRYSTGKIEASNDGTLYAYVTRRADDAESIVARGSTQFACGTFCPIRFDCKGQQPTHLKLEFDSGPLASLQESEITLEQLEKTKQ